MNYAEAMVLTRRELLCLGAGVLVAGTVGTGLHEPYEIAVTQLEIRLQRLPAAFDHLRIAQLSDIHFDTFIPSSHLARAVQLINAQKPDLVVLTGDFVTIGLSHHKAHAEQAWPCSELLRKLVAPLGTFAVLGNHDHGTNPELVTEALTTCGIEVLRNRSAAIEKGSKRFWLTGIDDVLRGQPRPEKALQHVPSQECTIVAVHEPDFADEMVRYPVDLQLSGHSHGGQIRLPGAGALYVPPGARKYPMGYYGVGGLQLYTNRGFGVIGIPMRLLCPPEITIVTLRAAS